MIMIIIVEGFIFASICRLLKEHVGNEIAIKRLYTAYLFSDNVNHFIVCWR